LLEALDAGAALSHPLRRLRNMSDSNQSRRHRALAAIAASQLGCFTYRQVIDAGFGRATAAALVEQGRWCRISDGVYMPAGVPISRDAQVMAAVLGVPGSHASHQTAARLHGLPVFGRPSVELSVLRHTNHEERLAGLHELKDVLPSDLEKVGPIPVTTVPRTIVDLAALHRRPRLERVLDDALVRRLTTVADVSYVLERVARRGKPGVRLLRALLAARAEGLIAPTSELERIFYTLIDSSTLPMPVRQWHPPWWDSPEGCVDAAWPAYRVITEADGRRWHTRDEHNERDKYRDGLAAMHGYQVQRFTYKQATQDGRWVLDVLGGLLGSRGWLAA
jgi:hypothetical protein